MVFSCFATVVNGEGEESVAKRFAVVNIDSGAVGSSVNYFVLRPIMEYDNKEGVAVGTMFNSVVFATDALPQSGSEAESTISLLFKDGTCIPAADTVAGEMKDDGFLGKDEKYPLYVAVPFVGYAFQNAKDKSDFCRYYIDTLVGVFNSKKYGNVCLAGVYLCSRYDTDPTLRAACIEAAKEMGLLCIISTAVGCDIEGIKVFADNKKVSNQLAMKNTGYTLTLDGVPDDNSNAPYDDLLSDFDALKNQKIGSSDLLFKFRAYNDIYDCASAIENTVPNPNGRAAYDLIKEIIDCPFDQSSFVNKTEENTGNTWFYITGTAVALVGTAGILYLVYVLVKKGKNNG